MNQRMISLVGCSLIAVAIAASLQSPQVSTSAALPARDHSVAQAPALGEVTTDSPDVRITVVPKIPGAPFTAFSAVFPADRIDSIFITITPSPGELALAQGDPANLEVIDLLTNTPLTCSADQTQLTCIVPGPGRFGLQVSEAVAGARGGPAPITSLPLGAGSISIGATATPTASPQPDSSP